MATILDSLIVLLTLDSSGFKKGRDDVENGLDQTASKVKKNAKNIEESGKSMGDMFGSVQAKLVGMLAAFAGYRGMEALTSAIIQGDSALGLLSKTIGTSVETLSSWGGAAERFGGSAQAIIGTFQGLQNQIQQFKFTGEGIATPFLKQLGVAVEDANGKARDISDIMLDVADIMSKKPVGEANYIGRTLGLDQGTINLMILGREKIESLLAEQKKLGIASRESAEAALKFKQSFLDVGQVLESIFRTIVKEAGPEIAEIAEGFTKWYKANKEIIDQKVHEAIKKISKAIKAVNWKEVGDSILKFAEGANKAAESVGGWNVVMEAFFVMWAAGRVAAVITAITSITGAVTGLAGAAGRAFAALSALSPLAALAATLSLTGDTPRAEMNADETAAKQREQWGKYLSGGGEIGDEAEYSEIFGIYMRQGGYAENFNKDFSARRERAKKREEEREKRKERDAERDGPYRTPDWLPVQPEPEGGMYHKSAYTTGARSSDVHNAAYTSGGGDDWAGNSIADKFAGAIRDALDRWLTQRFEKDLVDFLTALLGISGVSAPGGTTRATNASFSGGRAGSGGAGSGGVYAGADADVAQLMGLGWTREQAIGIVANIQGESSGNARTVGDGGQAYGLAQWHPDRQRAFKKWAGKDIRESTHEEQVGFINEELRNGEALERRAGRMLSEAKTAAEAADIITRKYERPARPDVDSAKRSAIAEAMQRRNMGGVSSGLSAASQGRYTNASASVGKGGGMSMGDIHVYTSATNGQQIAEDIWNGIRQRVSDGLVPQFGQGTV